MIKVLCQENSVELVFVVGTQSANRYTNCYLVVKALDFQSRGPMSKTTGWLQGRLSFSSFRAR